MEVLLVVLSLIVGGVLGWMLTRGNEQAYGYAEALSERSRRKIGFRIPRREKKKDDGNEEKAEDE